MQTVLLLQAEAVDRVILRQDYELYIISRPTHPPAQFSADGLLQLNNDIDAV